VLANSCKSDSVGNALIDNGYICETKYDGTRVWYFTKDNKFINRRGGNVRENYPDIQKIGGDYVLDGELCIFTAKKSDFSMLSVREHTQHKFRIELQAEKYPATFMVFDICRFEGKDVTSLPLRERKKLLQKIKLPMGVRLVKETTIKKAREEKQEGVMIKDLNSIYEMGKRTDSWIKLKFNKEKEVIFTTYEINTDNSLTLESENGIRAKCNDIKVKDKMPVTCEVEYLSEYANGKLRFPIIKRVL